MKHLSLLFSFILLPLFAGAETVIIDGLLLAEGYTWGTYVGSKGARRYVILGSAERVVK